MMMLNTLVVLAVTLSLTNAFTSSPLLNTRRFVANQRLSGASSSSSLYMSAKGGGVVITGAAGGVGFAYAGEFMDRGYEVVICDVKDCTAAAAALNAKHTNGTAYHTTCDVSSPQSVTALGDFAKENLGTIQYWINNAGVNGGRRALSEVPVEQVALVVNVNLLGTLYGTKVAMDIMANQVREKERERENQHRSCQFLFVHRANLLCVCVCVCVCGGVGWCDGTHFQHGR